MEHYALSDKPMDYRILHVDEDQDRMYVGCKDHVLSMDINNITHATQKVHLFIFLFPVCISIRFYVSILYASRAHVTNAFVLTRRR